MIFYSKSTRGFYSVEVHGRAIPSDAVALRGGAKEHQDLLFGQSEGRLIVSDPDGYPRLQDPRPLTNAEAAVVLRSARDVALNQTDWLVARHRDQVDMDYPTSLSAAQFQALLAYRNSLRGLPGTTGFPHVALPAPPGFLASEQ